MTLDFETYQFNLTGIITGAAAFLIIAFARYITIKAEYYFTKRFWIAFLVVGLCSVAGSLLLNNILVSTILGIFGFSFLWGIGEIIEQEKRVNKGWYPKRKKE